MKVAWPLRTALETKRKKKEREDMHAAGEKKQGL
jgi:hypothetical protein